MSDILIDIALPCLHGLEIQAYRLIYHLIKTAEHPEKFRIWLGIDQNKEENIKDDPILSEIEKLSNNIVIMKVKTGFNMSSLSHSVTLNQLIQNFTAPYTMTIDSDCFFMRKHWDTVLYDLLSKYDVVGVPYADEIHYQNFPCGVLVALKTETFRKYQIDCRPENLRIDRPLPSVTVNESISDLVGIPVGQQFRADTMSELCTKLKSICSSFCFKPVTDKSLKIDVYLYEDQPFATHSRKSHHCGDNGYYDNKMDNFVDGIVDWYQKKYQLDLSEIKRQS